MDSTLNHTKPGFRLGMFGGSELGGMDYSVGAGIDAISTYRHRIKTIDIVSRLSRPSGPSAKSFRRMPMYAYGTGTQ